jgi:hypothetical protein
MTIWAKLWMPAEEADAGRTIVQPAEAGACECDCAALPVHVKAFLDERGDEPS